VSTLVSATYRTRWHYLDYLGAMTKSVMHDRLYGTPSTHKISPGSMVRKMTNS